MLSSSLPPFPWSFMCRERRAEMCLFVLLPEDEEGGRGRSLNPQSRSHRAMPQVRLSLTLWSETKLGCCVLLMAMNNPSNPI